MNIFISIARAALTVPSPQGLDTLPTPITQPRDLETLAEGILGWMFWLLIILSIVFFLVSGYRYATSGGDPEKVKTANKTLIYGAIAVAVAVLAAGLPILISNFLGGP